MYNVTIPRDLGAKVMIGKKYSVEIPQRAVGWCETEERAEEIHPGSCDAERLLSAAGGQGIIGCARYRAEAYPVGHFRRRAS